MSRHRPNPVTVLARIKREEYARLPPHKRVAERKCLCCGGMFTSQWIGNRMCPNCLDRKDGNAWVK